MKIRVPLLLLMVVALVGAGASRAAEIRTIAGKPLVDAVKTKVGSVRTAGAVRVPMITWGGDVATIHARDQNHFRDQGLDVELFVENNFPKQVAGALEGKTPYVRGTMGMINAAAEVFAREGVELTVIYQLTWSTGGDAIVVRPGIKTPKGLKGKTVALQLYGPHMDYLGNILNSAKVPFGSVTYKWFEELTLPTYDTGGKVVDPVNAFLEDKRIDAAMAIIPDALNLTSGGDGGTGSAGSVKGARILLSTKTASRVIADVYAVRGDYLKSNRADVERFVRALMTAEEDFSKLLAEKSSRRAQFQQVLTTAADELLGSPQATPDVEALLGDCEFVGHGGNVAFFTGQGTTRTLSRLTSEIQTAFGQMGLMHGKPKLANAGWDYNALGRGLANATAVAVANKAPKKQFDTQRVAAKIEKQIAVEPTTWAEEGTLFQNEINFEPNQSEFSESRYAEDFQKALEIAETYGGALVVVEGHSDPLGVLKARQNGEQAVVVRQMEQQAKNLSLDRSRAVRESFLTYAKKRKFTTDESQFLAVGLGIASPKFSPPRTKEEWAANRRVVFRIKQVEAELTEFTPLE